MLLVLTVSLSLCVQPEGLSQVADLVSFYKQNATILREVRRLSFLPCLSALPRCEAGANAQVIAASHQPFCALNRRDSIRHRNAWWP